MQGHICLVTGATSGIGQVTARALAGRGATVLVAGRDAQKAADTVASIRQQTGNRGVEPLVADLSVQAQVRRLALEVRDRFGALHVLINNAGAYFRKRQQSADGIEMTLALNLLSPFLLTNLLLDPLQASAPARIVNVSSIAHRFGRMDVDGLQGQRRYISLRAYSQSKLGLLLFTYELARHLDGTRVTANALHPGISATNIGRAYGKAYDLFRPFFRRITRTPQEAARTIIFLATSPRVEGVTGQYFADEKTVQSSPASYDIAAAWRLWETCAAMTGLAQIAEP